MAPIRGDKDGNHIPVTGRESETWEHGEETDVSFSEYYDFCDVRSEFAVSDGGYSEYHDEYQTAEPVTVGLVVSTGGFPEDEDGGYRAAWIEFIARGLENKDPAESVGVHCMLDDEELGHLIKTLTDFRKRWRKAERKWDRERQARLKTEQKPKGAE